MLQVERETAVPFKPTELVTVLFSLETPTKRGDLFSEEDDANLNDDLKSLNGLVTCPKISLFAVRRL